MKQDQIEMVSLRLVCILLQTFLVSCFLLNSPALSAAPEKVSIQLKWQHAFQFAGYYAAIEKGFYKDEGLDVTLKEIDYSKSYVDQVLSGESEYGVSDSTLLIYHLQDKPVVLINQIFQHSPLIFLSLRGSGIISPYKMVGKTLSYNIGNKGDAPLSALLTKTLKDASNVKHVPVNENQEQNFIDGKVDVISAYSTSQPHIFKERRVAINIINPQSYGIDYYGDNLFTTRKELAEHPERVEKMSQATIKGWQYALEHPDEIIQLIRKKYAPALSKAHLQYEAQATRQMILPDLIELGSVDPQRYQQAAKDYQQLGFTRSTQIKKDFFYNQTDASVQLTGQEKTWLKKHPQVTFGGLADWAPFDFVNKKGQYNGIANDYLQLIAKKTGLILKPQVDEWSKQLNKLKEKKIDLLASAYFTEERSQFATYSTPYSEIVEYFFIRDDLNVKTLEDLNGKRLATPKDYAQINTIKKHFPKIKHVLVDGLEDAIDAVIQNRADILYDGYTVLAYTLKKDGISNIIPFRSTRKIVHNSIHFISRKDVPELASIIQKGLDAITEAEKQLIYKKWVGAKPKTQTAGKKIELSKIEQQWLGNHPVIRLGADANWAPYDFIDSSGKLQGISGSIIQLIEQRLGIKFKLTKQNSWSETLNKAKNHKIDLLTAIVKTQEREKYLQFTESYFKPLHGIYTKKNNTGIGSIKDLANKTVAIEKQYYLHETLAKEYPHIKLIPVNTTLDALKAIFYGKADAYIGTQGVANWVAEKNGLNNLNVIPENNLGETEIRLAVRGDWPILQGILDKVLASISEAEHSEIRRKWLGIKVDKGIKKLKLSEQEQQWLDQHKTIRFSGAPNWLPFEGFDKKGNYIGIVADYLSLIEQKIGIKIDEIPTQTWSESVDNFKQGKVDILSETTDSDLKPILTFTQPVVNSPVIIVMRNDVGHINSLSQIKHKKIALVKGYGYVPAIALYMTKNRES